MQSTCSSAHSIYRQLTCSSGASPFLQRSTINASAPQCTVDHAMLQGPAAKAWGHSITWTANAQLLVALYRSISSNPSDSYPLHTWGSRYLSNPKISKACFYSLAASIVLTLVCLETLNPRCHWLLEPEFGWLASGTFGNQMADLLSPWSLSFRKIT